MRFVAIFHPSFSVAVRGTVYKITELSGGSYRIRYRLSRVIYLRAPREDERF